CSRFSLLSRNPHHWSSLAIPHKTPSPQLSSDGTQGSTSDLDLLPPTQSGSSPPDQGGHISSPPSLTIKPPPIQSGMSHILLGATHAPTPTLNPEASSWSPPSSPPSLRRSTKVCTPPTPFNPVRVGVLPSMWQTEYDSSRL